MSLRTGRGGGRGGSRRVAAGRGGRAGAPWGGARGRARTCRGAGGSRGGPRGPGAWPRAGRTCPPPTCPAWCAGTTPPRRPTARRLRKRGRALEGIGAKQSRDRRRLGGARAGAPSIHRGTLWGEPRSCAVPRAGGRATAGRGGAGVPCAGARGTRSPPPHRGRILPERGASRATLYNLRPESPPRRRNQPPPAAPGIE